MQILYLFYNTTTMKPKVKFLSATMPSTVGSFKETLQQPPPRRPMPGFEGEHLRAVFVYAKTHKAFCLLLVKLPGCSQLESFQVLLVKHNSLL